MSIRVQITRTQGGIKVARTEKNLTKKLKVSKLVNKVKSLVGGKKTTPKRAIKDMSKKGPPLVDHPIDPAHSPGHRRLNLR